MQQYKHLSVAEWREPDKNNELTAITIGIVYGKDRDLFKDFALLR